MSSNPKPSLENKEDLTDLLTQSLNYSESIPCKICQKPARKLDSQEIYICEAGHKNGIFGLVEQEKTPEIQKEGKRKLSVQIKCKFCGKTAELLSEQKVFGKIARKYTCGCSEIVTPLAHPENRDMKWLNFFEFQKNGVEFVENADYSALIADEMGLGKTIQALGTLRYNYQELVPCLMVCEAAKVYDWKEEFSHWVGDKFTEIRDEPIIHNSGTYGLCDAFNNHIISMSLLSKKKVLKSIINYGFKFLIVDECHSFKNESSDRTYALQQIAQHIPYKIFLSGTPVMNRIAEYFVPLNILAPHIFPSKSRLEAWCDRDYKGRVLGISEYRRKDFFNVTGKFIIRRTKKEVGIQLPKLMINHKFINIEEKAYVQSYNANLDDLENILNSKKSAATAIMDILAIMAKLRHICGLAKVKSTIADVKEFIESTDQENKITVGVHHKLVGEFLMKGLAEFNPITISDEDALTKNNRLELFKSPDRRVLIASILGAGQGLNIQFCKNAIIMEREWNPAKEEQFEGRFHRIVKNSDGSIKKEFAEDDAVIIDYTNAKNSIDEYFDNMVRLKREIVKSGMDYDVTTDTDFIMELANNLIKTRLKTVGI